MRTVTVREFMEDGYLLATMSTEGTFVRTYDYSGAVMEAKTYYNTAAPFKPKGGAPDAEFGKLVVTVPKKRGDGGACFYEKGLVLEKKRLPYSEIKDVVLVAAEPGTKITLKQAARDMGVLWIYPKKGTAIGLREMNYQFENEIMEKIKRGLGF